MKRDRAMTPMIDRVRRMAADEAERALIGAAALMGEAPGALEHAEKAIREGVQGIGAGVLAAALALTGKGDEGSSRPCVCGGRQKYMNDRERRQRPRKGPA